MARVKLGGLESRYAHFGLYNTGAGGDEPIVVRRKTGIPPDYDHTNSMKVQHQRERFRVAVQHFANLTPTQKEYYRRQIGFVSVVGSPSVDKLLTGRQLFISREISELLVKQKQLEAPFEVCIMLVDEAYNPLKGEMWLYWQESEEAEPEALAGDELIPGSFLFRTVKPGQFVYHPYGESEGYYDPEGAETWLTQDELRQYHYHILKDSYRELIIAEKWTIGGEVELELVIEELWSPPQPPELEQVFDELWTTTAVPMPEFELVMLEEWTVEPPEFELVMLEEWTVEPPEFELVMLEEWTVEPPEFEEIIDEHWQIDASLPEFECVIDEEWTGTTFTLTLYAKTATPSARCGYIQRTYGTVGEYWPIHHDGDGTIMQQGTSQAGGVIIGVRCTVATPTPKYNELKRGLFAFRTEDIPDNAIIMRAEVWWWGSGKSNTAGWPMTVGLVTTHDVNPENFELQDFHDLNDVPASNSISFNNFNGAGWNKFLLNSVGLAHLNLNGPTVWGMRSNYDRLDAPPPPIANAGCSVQGYSYDNQTYHTYQARLVVTYVLP